MKGASGKQVWNHWYNYSIATTGIAVSECDFKRAEMIWCEAYIFVLTTSFLDECPRKNAVLLCCALLSSALLSKYLQFPHYKFTRRCWHSQECKNLHRHFFGPHELDL